MPLIREAEESEFSHVVVFLTEDGIHWRPQTESACILLACILKPEYDAKVLPRQEFIDGLYAVIAEEEAEA
jgi:hypothetical protein